MMKELRFEATRSSGEVSAILDVPSDPVALYVFAHGAGAGMRHAFMEGQSEDLVRRGVATFRYQFPYMEQGRRGPSPQPILLKTVQSAVAAARQAAPGLPVIAGGKSMGGRMTSIAQAADPIDGVRGLVFFGFPLHAPGKRSADRGAHLSAITVPMLFLQGTRDRLADLTLLEPLLESLGSVAEIEIVDDADHSFNMPKRAGKEDSQVREELADTVVEWVSARFQDRAE
jgi:predicted alpha/beta-hydrolase family hydrolase